MALKIFNTLSGEKEEFVPLKTGEVKMYVCGVTVYDSSHLGHCRFLLSFDVIYRYLRFCGYQVHYVRNFTDVDDKIIKRAQEDNVGCEVITEKYIEEFHRDASALGLLEPTQEPRATHHIAEIVKLIQRLEEKGLAYRVDGDVFYPVQGFAGYGKLSRKKIDELEAGARVEVDERKRSPLDFALWKSSKAGEPAWESPWGPGRPGWHIECSAMAMKHLGEAIDIHGGGQDLIFPHNENEMAQTEACTGDAIANLWAGDGTGALGGGKMSKCDGSLPEAAQAGRRLLPLGSLLGFFWKVPQAEQWSEDVLALANERDVARRERNWKRSDELRNALADKGVIVEDGAQGQKLKRK